MLGFHELEPLCRLIVSRLVDNNFQVNVNALLGLKAEHFFSVR